MIPRLSIIIPTHDRRELLRACLASIARQDAPVEAFEVVVVVDGSTDGTEQMLAELRPPFRLSLVVEERRGAAAARNAGAARSAGETLLFVDDDVTASESLVSAHLSAHSGRAARVGVGTIDRRVPKGADSFAQARADAARAHNEHLARRPLTYGDCYGGNFSVSRSLYRDVGGFAEDLTVENDFELAYRLARAGAEFVFVPDAVVQEERRDDWREIVTEQELRGRIAVELAGRHPEMLEAMELGGYDESPRRWIALRLGLLALRVPPRAVARVGLVLPRRSAGRWFAFAYRYAYWRGVTSATRVGASPLRSGESAPSDSRSPRASRP